MSESNSSPTIQLHRLCSRLIGGAGGGPELVSSHYRSALQLLTSTQNNHVMLKEDEISEKLQKQFMREGRTDQAIRLAELVEKLKKVSSDVLRNRGSVLALLSSLSDRKGATQFNAFSSTPLNHPISGSSGISSVSTPANLPPSASTPGLSAILPHNAAFHPPVPPKPRSRPTSMILQHSESDSAVQKTQSINRSSSSRHLNGVKAGPVSSGSSSESAGKQTIPGVRPAPVHTSEDEVVKELVYVFQGIEGRRIKREPGGQNFHLTKGTVVSPCQNLTILKLCELGWLYLQVHNYAEQQRSQKEYGLVGQSFITALREELTEYYRLLAVLEGQVREGGVTLLQLMVWTAEPIKRFKLLVEIITACANTRGGSLASCLYGFLNQGDPVLRFCVSSLLTAACRPLYTMLIRWILDGNLEDPHQEFFISSDPNVQGEAMWHAKYNVRQSMIPRFISYTWSQRILITGKSINFLRIVCRDNTPVMGKQKLLAKLEVTDPASLFSCDVNNPLLEIAGEAYRLTARHVLDVMFDKFNFLSHLAALRKYLLLGQGDVMRYLLDLLENELSQPATQLFPHNLAGILETAIRATNTQYESSEILDRLDVRLLEIQPGDTGWDVFSLDYKVSGPIGVVFTPDAMTQYLMLFNTLWRAKRMEWVLSKVWKKLATLHKMARVVEELKPVLHLSNLLASEMIHFIHQMAYYITFEVMECGWDQLVKQIDKAESLEDIIQAHEEFLSALLARSLLDESSRETLAHLRAIYDRILEFQGIQDRLYEDVVTEYEARQNREAMVEQRTKKGSYGTTAELEAVDTERRKTFIKTKLATAKAQLKIVSNSYQDMVRTLLLELTCRNDENLQYLAFRLDFNEHYKKKDSRLSRPLQFSHRRLSVMNMSMTGSQMSSSVFSPRLE